ncbi:MAG: translation initiation factor 2 [Oscillospiraceae bacterium]|nr:translation initiation factor 2 [Oscillospiraceae bacterium]
MVKGITKQVIVVKTPVSGMFEQAIFILGDNVADASSVDADGILSEACAIADDYVRTHCAPVKKSTKALLLTALISSCVTLVLSCLAFFFII